MGDYTDALAKDLKRIEGELKKLEGVLKKNPNDAGAQKTKKGIEAFLQKDSLQKRYDNALKMDATALRRKFGEMGF